jgi:hypothetical protein
MFIVTHKVTAVEQACFRKSPQTSEELETFSRLWCANVFALKQYTKHQYIPGYITLTVVPKSLFHFETQIIKIDNRKFAHVVVICKQNTEIDVNFICLILNSKISNILFSLMVRNYCGIVATLFVYLLLLATLILQYYNIY